jgi:signal transduction histidine kinase
VIALAALAVLTAPGLSLRVQEGSGAWRTLDPPRLNAGYTHAPLTFCADLPDDSPVLVVPGNFDAIAFDGGAEITSRDPLLARIHAATGQGTLCFRITSENAINVEPRAMSYAAFIDHASEKTYADGIYYGIMLAVLLFNVLAAIALRERSRVDYLVYQAAFLLVQLGFDGVWVRVLPFARASVQRFELLLLGATMLSALTFARAFLDAERTPVVAKHPLYRTAFALASLMTVLAAVLPLQAAFLCIAAASLVLPLLVIALAIPKVRRGEQAALLFVTGFGVFLVTIVATALTDLGLVPSLLPYDATTKVGSAIEAIILTAALGTQIAAVRAKQEAAERARAEALRTVVAGVAHEIGNPLNAMKGALAEIDRRADEGPLRAASGIAGRGAGRIEGVVNALRSALQGSVVAPREIAVQHALDEVCALAQGAAAEKGVRIDRKPTALSVNAGPSELEQVLHNLVINAIHASPEGATITLTTADAGMFAELRVQDEGSGVPAELRDRIFDAFFTTKPAQAGAGLGLWVSREICRRRGGDLVLAESSRGACFVVRWPRYS